MCWRDDIVMERVCSFCGQTYYGDLGHRNCPALSKNKSFTSSSVVEEKPQKDSKEIDHPF